MKTQSTQCNKHIKTRENNKHIKTLNGDGILYTPLNFNPEMPTLHQAFLVKFVFIMYSQYKNTI